MVQWHWNLHKRKRTGGRRLIWRGKRRFERGGIPTETELGKTKIKLEKGKGGITKARLLKGQWANIYDPENKKVVKSKITEVIENKASREYSRRGVITKGAIIKTEAGKAVVVSRPGQNGLINARLLKK